MATTLQRTHLRTAGNVETVIGLWLLISPFILNSNTEALWSFIISGAVILILAITQSGNNDSVWPSWVTLIVGAWLLLAPLIVPYNTQSTWNGLIVGVIVVGLSLWALLSGRSTMDENDRPPNRTY